MLPNKILIPLHKYLREPVTPDVQGIISIFNSNGCYLADQSSEKLSFRVKPWSTKKKIYIFVLWLVISFGLMWSGNQLPYENELGTIIIVIGATILGLYPMYGLIQFTTYEYQYDVYLKGEKNIEYVPVDSKLKAFFKSSTMLIWLFGGVIVTPILTVVFGYLLAIIWPPQ